MADLLAAESERRTHQLHVELGPGTLEDMVDDLVDGALQAVGWRLAGRPEENRLVLRAALRQGMKRYIVGFDVCGLASFCRDASRFDPWG